MDLRNLSWIWDLWPETNSLVSVPSKRASCVGVSMQTEDPSELTNPTGTDPSQLGWHLWRVGDRSQTVRTWLWRVEWRVSSLKTQATWPARQKLKERQKSPRSSDNLALLCFDPTMFGLLSLRLAQIRPRSSLFLTQICLIPTNPTQIYSNSAKTLVSPTLTRPKLQ